MKKEKQMSKHCQHNDVIIHQQEYQADGKIVNYEKNLPEGTKYQYILICQDCLADCGEITEEQANYLKSTD